MRPATSSCQWPPAPEAAPSPLAHPDTEGGVISCAIDESTGALDQISRQPSQGAMPCYLDVTADGRHVAVANYNSGSVAVLSANPDGDSVTVFRIDPATGLLEATGGPRRGAQTGLRGAPGELSAKAQSWRQAGGRAALPRAARRLPGRPLAPRRAVRTL